MDPVKVGMVVVDKTAIHPSWWWASTAISHASIAYSKPFSGPDNNLGRGEELKNTAAQKSRGPPAGLEPADSQYRPLQEVISCIIAMAEMAL